MTIIYLDVSHQAIIIIQYTIIVHYKLRTLQFHYMRAGGGGDRKDEWEMKNAELEIRNYGSTTFIDIMPYTVISSIYVVIIVYYNTHNAALTDAKKTESIEIWLQAK